MTKRLQRVPFEKSLEETKNLIQKKKNWILKKQDEYRKTQPEVKEYSYLPSTTLPYLGNNYTIELRNLHPHRRKDSNSNSVLFDEHEKVDLSKNKFLFYVKDSENDQNINDEFIKNKIKGLYENWLYEQAQIIFKKKINEFSKIIEVSPNELQIKRLKNRWGSVTK